MRSRHATSLLFAVGVATLAACASPPKSTLRGTPPPPPPAPAPATAETVTPAPERHPAPALEPMPPPQDEATAPDLGREVVRIARGYLGAPYRLSGRGPDSFDCSGLVQRSFATIGVRLPRTSGELARVGRSVPADALMPGDLVLFANSRGAINHVGIFTGRGRFVHASSSRGVVEDLLGSRWFGSRFVGGRRVIGD